MEQLCAIIFNEWLEKRAYMLYLGECIPIEKEYMNECIKKTVDEIGYKFILHGLTKDEVEHTMKDIYFNQYKWTH